MKRTDVGTRWFLGILVSGTCALPGAFGQLPKGQFLTDTMKLGSPVVFSLSFRHNPATEVFFPDSTHDFSPFQLRERRYFPTRTTRNSSLDSDTYTLVSFDIKPVQRLSLPVFVWNGRDCTTVWAYTDSIRFNQLVRGAAKGQALRTDAQMQHLAQQLNYPYALLVALGLMLGGGLVYGLFGEALRRQWRLYQMRRRHADFLRTFQRLGRDINTRKNLANVEKAALLWKKYLERLERRAITSLTTRELIHTFPDEQLPDALREVDASVYGGVFSPRIQESLGILRELATRQYRQRRREALLAGRKQA
ncbi:MAG: hypothetical protein LH606_12740 [Cytophagaceae bacterium]|nr:hypothetical protein [Cytophagaceae bacterium]